jgi:hypothetical protein
VEAAWQQPVAVDQQQAVCSGSCAAGCATCCQAQSEKGRIIEAPCVQQCSGRELTKMREATVVQQQQQQQRTIKTPCSLLPHKSAAAGL